MRALLEEIYTQDTERAVRFRYALIVFDLFTLLFLFVSSFYYGTALVHWLDMVFGLVIATDFLARVWIARSRLALILSLQGMADILVIFSLLLPLLGENLAFLRVVRAVRLLRSYRVLQRLRQDFSFFKKNEEIILSATNLFLFLFVMTALIFETQVGKNADIKNYVDALYFTVTTLTTTGFGDITLVGDDGKLIAVAVMIFGVSLFIRLIQTVFRPSKIRFSCPDCALLLHDRDAVHCKHCGRVLAIPNEGVH